MRTSGISCSSGHSCFATEDLEAEQHNATRGYQEMRVFTRTTSAAAIVLALYQVSCSGGAGISMPNQEARKFEKQFMNLDYRPKPNGYTHVVTSSPGRLIFVSGQGGSSPEGELPDDFASQAENTFKNLENCLQLAGATFQDVVKINYYLKEMSDLAELRKIRANYLNMENPPAATAVQTGLGDDLLLEVEVVATVRE